MSNSILILKCCFFILVLGLQHVALCQNEDKQVVMGGGFPAAIFTFENDTVLIDTARLPNSDIFLRAQGSICNKDGELQFYTNGYTVFNKLHQVMEGADSITFSSIAKQLRGLLFFQNCLILKKPESDSLYYVIIFDFADNCIAGLNTACVLQYAEIDMSQNNGLGKVISTNNKLLETPISGSNLTACRHANGRDWWIVKKEWETNKWFKFLLSPIGIEGPYAQNIGSSFLGFPGSGTYSTFSNNGELFVSTGILLSDTAITIEIMDFDRCTGEISNLRSPIIIGKKSDDLKNCTGISFSSNDRFLYIVQQYRIYQLDMLSNDWQSSLTELIDTTDNNQLDFEKTYLAPDGKIYIGNSCAAVGLTVINNPEAQGTACNITYSNTFGILPQSYCGGAVPNMPNFKLGALPGPCDTVYNKPEPIPTAILFPTAFTPNGDNLNDSFKPSYTGTVNNYQLSIYNRWGNKVFETNNKDTGWDGTYNNTIKADTYAWYCTFTNYKNEVKILKGNVALVR
jgi:gliding motility-associated-like protein